MSVKEKRAALKKAILDHKSKQADKHDSGKARVELVAPQFVGLIAQVLDHGAKKYGAWNWTKGLAWSRVYASTLRHLFLWYCGEDKDPESGLSHLSHAATNIMFLSVWQELKRGEDDRPIL